MTRHLAPPLVRTALDRGTYVEQLLGGFVVDGQPAIRWILLRKGVGDDDFDEDEDEDAGEVQDDGDGDDDEDVFVLKYDEALDGGR